jgi:hypothetical protein
VDWRSASDAPRAAGFNRRFRRGETLQPCLYFLIASRRVERR